MKNKICRLFLTAVMVVACAGMWGCDYLKNDDEPVLIDSGLRRDYGFAMVSDTTALLPLHYYDHFENDYDDWEECTEMGLRLVGTRGREPKYWEGLTDLCAGDQNFHFTIEPLGDSTVFFVYLDTDSVLAYFIWKVEKEPVKKHAVWVSDYVDMNSSSTIMRTWKGGKLLFKNYEKFALLDTAENTITQVTKEEAGWPDGVEDAQYFGDDLMTIVLYPNNFSYSIVRNGKDTISTYYEEAPNSYDVVRERFNGRYIIRMKTDAWYVFSTDGSWQISEKPVAKYKTQHFITP